MLRADAPTGLRVTRLVQGFTQAELARACSISTGLLSEIETGRRHPSAATGARLAEALGIDPNTGLIVEIPAISAMYAEKGGPSNTTS